MGTFPSSEVRALGSHTAQSVSSVASSGDATARTTRPASPTTDESDSPSPWASASSVTGLLNDSAILYPPVKRPRHRAQSPRSPTLSLPVPS